MQNNEDLRRELAANGFKSALRFMAHHMQIDIIQAKSHIAHDIGVDRLTISRWQERGVDEQFIPRILRILNSIRPVWARYQLAPRQREVDIWKRMAANGQFKNY